MFFQQKPPQPNNRSTQNRRALHSETESMDVFKKLKMHKNVALSEKEC